MRRLLFTVVAVVVLAIAAAFVYVRLTSVEVVVFNNNCQPFSLHTGLPPALESIVGWLGVELPQDPIQPGGQTVIKVPRLTVDVEASRQGTVTLTVFGRTASLNIPGELEQVEFNGKPILGQRTSVDLGERSRHEVSVTCR